MPVGLDYYGMVQKILKLERLRSPVFKSGFTSPYQSSPVLHHNCIAGLLGPLSDCSRVHAGTVGSACNACTTSDASDLDFSIFPFLT